MEAVGIELASPDGSILIIATYCSGQCKLSDGSTVRFKSDIQKLTRRTRKFIIVDDFDARHSLWGNSRKNKNGEMLAEDIQAGHYVVLHSDSPSFYSPAGVGSTLGIVLTNITAITELSSDHLLVVFTVARSIDQRQQHRQQNYHKANWPLLQRHVEDRVNETQL